MINGLSYRERCDLPARRFWLRYCGTCGRRVILWGRGPRPFGVSCFPVWHRYCGGAIVPWWYGSPWRDSLRRDDPAA